MYLASHQCLCHSLLKRNGAGGGGELDGDGVPIVMANIYVFLYRYISIFWPKISIISLCINIFSHSKKSRRRCQFFSVFGRRRHQVNLPAPSPPIFTSVVFSISGLEVHWWHSVSVAQRSNEATSGQATLRCGDGDMWATSAVNRMAQWWGSGARGFAVVDKLGWLASTLGRKLAHFPYADARDRRGGWKYRYFKGKYRYIKYWYFWRNIDTYRYFCHHKVSERS